MNIINWKKRPLVYALVITSGFWFLISLLENLPDRFYFVGSVFLYLILLFELYSTKYYARRLLDQFQLPQVDEKDKLIHLIHHFILPSFAYFSFVLFVFFNHQKSAHLIILAIIFIIFSVLFTNVRAYYEDKFKLEQGTHAIYDIIVIIMMFVSSDSALQTFGFLGSSGWVTLAAILIAYTVLSMLLLIRKQQINNKSLQTLVVGALLLIAFLLVLQSFRFNNFAVALLSTLLFYFVVAVFHHQQVSSLSKAIIGEYFVVFLIFIVLMYGVV